MSSPVQIEKLMMSMGSTAVDASTVVKSTDREDCWRSLSLIGSH